MLFKKNCKTEVVFEVELFGAEVLTFNTYKEAVACLRSERDYALTHGEDCHSDRIDRIEFCEHFGQDLRRETVAWIDEEGHICQNVGRKFFKSTAKKHNPSVCRRLYWGFLNSLPK